MEPSDERGPGAAEGGAREDAEPAEGRRSMSVRRARRATPVSIRWLLIREPLGFNPSRLPSGAA